MTHKLMENQLRVNRERIGDTICEDLEKARLARSLLRTASRMSKRSKPHPDLPHQTTLSQTHHSCRWVLSISNQSWNKTSEQDVEMKIIAENQKDSLAKVEDWNKFHHFLVQTGVWSINNLWLKGKAEQWIPIIRVRPQFRQKDTWFLSHENAPAHSALWQRFLAIRSVISRPSHSPDLELADLFVIFKGKTSLKGKRFQNNDIKEKVTALINGAPLGAFHEYSMQILDRYFTQIRSHEREIKQLSSLSTCNCSYTGCPVTMFDHIQL